MNEFKRGGGDMNIDRCLKLFEPLMKETNAIPETDPSLISKIVERDDPAGKSEMEGVRDHED